MIRELDAVVLAQGLPDHRLEAGDVGTVVMVHWEGRAYEVEIATLGGGTIAVGTLPAGSVRPLRQCEIAYARGGITCVNRRWSLAPRSWPPPLLQTWRE